MGVRKAWAGSRAALVRLRAMVRRADKAVRRVRDRKATRSRAPGVRVAVAVVPAKVQTAPRAVRASLIRCKRRLVSGMPVAAIADRKVRRGRAALTMVCRAGGAGVN